MKNPVRLSNRYSVLASNGRNAADQGDANTSTAPVSRTLHLADGNRMGARALNPDITAGDIDARWQTSTLRSSSSTTDRRSAAEAPTGPRRSGTKSTPTALSAPWRSTGLRVRCSHSFRMNCAALRSVALSPRFVGVIMGVTFGVLRFRQASAGKLK